MYQTLAVTWSGVQRAGDRGKVIGFTVMLPPGAGADENGKLGLDIYAVAFSADDKQAGSLNRNVAMQLDADGRRRLSVSGFRYSGQMELPAGQYRVHVAVRGASTGQFASVWSEIAVP